MSGGVIAALRRPLVLLLLIAAALSGCRRVRGSQDVVGRYVLNRVEDRDVLELRPDGTYIHRYTAPGGATVVDSASWNLFHQGAWRITFENFAHHARRESFPRDPVARGAWTAEVQMGWTGRVRLVVDGKTGLAYLRQPGTSTGW